MHLWLDFKLFGNGWGLKSPKFDDRFYWLDGQLYTYMAGMGAQLHSIEWRHPRVGERRWLCGRYFVATASERRWLRVRISWAMVGLPKDLNEANAEIARLKRDLDTSY